MQKLHKKTSKYINKKCKSKFKSNKIRSHKIRSHKFRNHKFRSNKLGGGIFETIGKSLVQVPKEKNYTVRVPRSGLFKMLNPEKLVDKPTVKSLITITYNKSLDTRFNIADISPSIPISSNTINREPYVIINDIGKYLLVMYRIVKKKNSNTPKLLLHWLIGFINYVPTKIFNYIAPNTKLGKLNKFIFKLYKLPDTNDKSFIKINNINKKKAYDEFSTYINANNLLPMNNYIYNILVKGDSGEGLNLFNMFSKQNAKFSKFKSSKI